MWPLSLSLSPPPSLFLYACVYVCEMVVKIVEMHLPLGCFVDFLWLRAGRNARWARSWPVPLLDSDSNSDSDSCLCHMRGATMLFAVSQISRSLHNATEISHMYIVWFFSRPWLWLCSIWLSCLRRCWFYILHIPWRQTECPLSPCLECVFSYAFTENSCGWQLVQQSRAPFRFLFSPSALRFSFTLKWKNLWKDKLSSAKVRAEF